MKKVLEVILTDLEKAGIQTRGMKNIEADIEYNSIIATGVTIIENNDFKVVYDTENREVIFETTYSNRAITDEFIQQLLEIKGKLSLIKEVMNSMVQTEK